MENLRRALLALDLSKTDKTILQYLATNGNLFQIEKGYILHIMPDFSTPKQLDVAFQKLFAPEYPIDEKVKDKLSLDAQEIMGERPAFPFEVEVREGKPYEKLLHWIKIKEIQLLVAGKKALSEGSGITAKRVARNAHCNILFIPEGTPPLIEQIVVPIDFSENSLKALKQALSFKARRDDITVKAIYIVDLPPPDYYSRSLPGTGYRGILMESAKNAFQDFIAENKINADAFEMIYLENTRNGVSRQIQTFIAQESANTLTIIGAKGHSPFETFLFGSVTEKMVSTTMHSPILIIR